MKNILVIIMVLLSSCHKEEMKPKCTPLQHSRDNLFGSWTMCFANVYPVYSTPCFNPNNADEILVDYADREGDAFQLIRYNLKTGKKTVVPENVTRASSISWSRKNWIIFEGISAQGRDIFKMKPNGDSLIQLTFTGTCSGPEWNWEGDRFICRIGNSASKLSLIVDENGNTLDTVEVSHYKPSWQNPSGLLTKGVNTGVFVKNLGTGEIWSPFKNTSGSSYSGDSQWITEEMVLWSYSDGIYNGNVHTGEKTQIKESCDSVIYESPAYSYISGKVLFIRTVKEITGQYTGTAKTSLVIMNADDGSEEEEIDLE